MKRNIFIPLFATLLLCACDEEHVMYETAAKPGMTIDGSTHPRRALCIPAKRRCTKIRSQ